MTFKVGDKVTSEEFGDGVVDMLRSRSVRVTFENGCVCWFSLDGFFNSGNTQPHKNIKHKEAQGMDIPKLETGMVVEFESCFITTVFADIGKLIDSNGWSSLSKYNDDLTHKNNPALDIVKVYSQPERYIDYINTSLKHRKLIWQREEVKEMTVDEISKALGYPVKVVGGE